MRRCETGLAQATVLAPRGSVPPVKVRLDAKGEEGLEQGGRECREAEIEANFREAEGLAHEQRCAHPRDAVAQAQQGARHKQRGLASQRQKNLPCQAQHRRRDQQVRHPNAPGPNCGAREQPRGSVGAHLDDEEQRRKLVTEPARSHDRGEDVQRRQRHANGDPEDEEQGPKQWDAYDRALNQRPRRLGPGGGALGPPRAAQQCPRSSRRGAGPIPSPWKLLAGLRS
mmetsp:Transcript_93155/g.285095  ORF Transcript_93155/g.285095 Transcript_93155/m.285095 type:complete len:227 (-) Transcript_93155:947-1627(-)